MDVARTLLLMAGLDDGAFPGRDVREASRESPPEPRFAMSGQGISASVELEGWLLELYLRDVVDSDSAPDRPGRGPLYHLTRPPCTTDRLLDDPPRPRMRPRSSSGWAPRARRG